MAILCLDDRVSRVSLQPIVTRPTQLFARHRFHWLATFFAVVFVTFVLAIAFRYALS
jgi:hypothetical protein